MRPRVLCRSPATSIHRLLLSPLVNHQTARQSSSDGLVRLGFVPSFLFLSFPPKTHLLNLIGSTRIGLASVNFLEGTRLLPSKKIMAVYPLFLFYFLLAWMILIQ